MLASMKSISKKSYHQKSPRDEELKWTPTRGWRMERMHNIRKWLGKKKYGDTYDQCDQKDFPEEFPS